MSASDWTSCIAKNTLFSTDGAANFKDFCYTIVWGKGEKAKHAEKIVHNPTGDAVDLPANNDIDDTYSIQNNWSDLGAVMCRGDMKSGLLSKHFKKGTGPHKLKVFQGSSPEFTIYFEQGLLEMRKLQAATSGTPSKKREYKELLASPELAEKKMQQAMRAVEVLKEKHATLSRSRKAAVR